AGELSLAPRHRRTTLMRLHQVLREQPAGRLEACLAALRRQLRVGGRGALQAPRMTHDDLRDIARRGIELGAHCEQHVDMRGLTADETLHELETSRAVLREVTGQQITGFAYPGGRQNAEVQQMVARAGFHYAAGT